MDPITYDRWWRKRVQKEEYDQVKHLLQPAPTYPSLLLNPLGAPQLFSYATEEKAREFLLSTQNATESRKHDSSKSSESDLSYPKTPNFSETVASTEVMRRLDVLEQELIQEKVKREVVEKQMKQLLERTKPAN